MITYNKETSEEGRRKSLLLVRKTSSNFNHEKDFLLITTEKIREKLKKKK